MVMVTRYSPAARSETVSGVRPRERPLILTAAPVGRDSITIDPVTTAAFFAGAFRARGAFGAGGALGACGAGASSAGAFAVGDCSALGAAEAPEALEAPGAPEM